MYDKNEDDDDNDDDNNRQKPSAADLPPRPRQRQCHAVLHASQDSPRSHQLVDSSPPEPAQEHPWSPTEQRSHGPALLQFVPGYLSI